METIRDITINNTTLRPSRRIRTRLRSALVSTVHTLDTGWETLVVPAVDGVEQWHDAREMGRWDSADEAEREHARISVEIRGDAQ